MDIHTKTNLKIVGKIDTRVYYYYHGELRSRTYFIPVQPGTPAQQTWWLKFRQGVQAWKILPQGQKNEYNEKAKRFKFSGFNLFMREWLTS